MRLLIGLAVAAFWNGITSVFVWQAVLSHLRGRPEWFLTFFIIPFVLIGLAMIGYVFYAFFALFNPRPTLRLRPAQPRLGTALECDWEFRGATGRIRRLSIVIEGIEESRYQRGTRTYTDKSVFARLPVVELDHHARIRRGGLAAMIPAHYAPSFRAGNNCINWVLRLHGEIARWPDVSEEYQLAMLPAIDSENNTPPRGANVIPAEPGETRLPDGGRLRVELDEPGGGFRPGDTFTGRARWELPQTPKEVVVRLFWFTRGKGTKDTVVLDEQRLPVGSVGESKFRFTLPLDQPPSIDGTLISVVWAVELVVLPAAEAARVEFVVGAQGQPITLTAVPETESDRRRSKRWFRPA